MNFSRNENKKKWLTKHCVRNLNELQMLFFHYYNPYEKLIQVKEFFFNCIDVKFVDLIELKKI
jgi:hypothetical protein